MLSADTPHTGAELALVHAVNDERHRHGLGSLRVSARLGREGDRHSIEMLRHDYLGHEAPDGRSFARRIRDRLPAERRGVGEVLAWRTSGAGTRNPQTIVRMWLESPPHRSVILDRSVRRIGVGRITGRLHAETGVAVSALLAA